MKGSLQSLITPRTATLAGLLILVLGHIAVLAYHLLNLQKFHTHWTAEALSILRYCYIISVFGLIPVTWFLLRLRRTGRAAFADIQSWLPLRAWLYGVILAIAITSIAQALGLFAYSNLLTRSFFLSTLLGCLDLWALLILSSPSLARQTISRPWRVLDAVLMPILVILLLLEGTLTLWARYATSHLPIDATSIEATLAMYRQKPYHRHFNFTFNSGGYHDVEFFRATDEDFVVALHSDSFGIGSVPYAYNFATVAERQLQETLGQQYRRVAVHNFSVAGIRMPEHAYLLHTESLQTSPTYVVLCVYVGSIKGFTPTKRRRYIFQNWRTWIVTKGVFARRAGKAEDGIGTSLRSSEESDDGVPDYIHDPQKEPPLFSEPDFLNLMSRRLEIVNPMSPRTQRKYREFFPALGQFHSWLGDKLLVVVIPDEYQVNDELYQKLIAPKEHPDHYERDYPQQRIRDYCEEHGIPLLDLLPVLAEANRDERVYHLRETHWNARGNALGGREIAKFILNRLREKKAEQTTLNGRSPSRAQQVSQVAS